METLKLKIDYELFDVINSTGKYKIEFSHFEENRDTNDLLYSITISPEMGNPDILREYDEVMKAMKEEFDNGNYCFYPTFEWALNEEFWNTSAVYEIVENKGYNN